MSSKIKIEQREVRRYSEALKRAIVSDLEGGALSMSEALEYYGVPCRRTVDRWRQMYGKVHRATKIVRVIMKDEQKRIRDLEKALADATLKNAFLEGAVEYLSENVSAEVKKKLSMKLSAELPERVIASPSSAKKEN